MNLANLTLTQAVELVKKNELNPADLIKYFYEQITADNARPNKLNAVVHLDIERALLKTKEQEKSAKTSLLAGVPVFIKNNMHIEGLPVNCASQILENYISPYTGGACGNLEKNGGVVMGMANMDEFAMGSSNEFSKFGIVRNPHNRDYIPGGSSGGSAALVGGGLGLAALGSDTGGSIRQPAACCGIVGLKPTYGRVSRYGVVAFGSSFDQIGPMTKTVPDAALLLQAIAGYDSRDSTSSQAPVPDYSKDLNRAIVGKKIAIPKEFFVQKSDSGGGLDEDVANALDRVKNFYREAGCEVKEVSMPYAKYAIDVYYILSSAEASSNLSRFDGIRYGNRNKKAKNHIEVFSRSRSQGFGPEVKRRILIGSHVLSSGYFDAYYLKAQKARKLIQDEYKKVMENHDAILSPVMPGKVFKLGEKISSPVDMYLSDIFTVSTNVVGAPAIALPCGKDLNGLPIGFQLIGDLFNEAGILNLANIYQRENPFG